MVSSILTDAKGLTSALKHFQRFLIPHQLVPVHCSLHVGPLAFGSRLWSKAEGLRALPRDQEFRHCSRAGLCL